MWLNELGTKHGFNCLFCGIISVSAEEEGGFTPIYLLTRRGFINLQDSLDFLTFLDGGPAENQAVVSEEQV